MTTLILAAHHRVRVMSTAVKTGGQIRFVVVVGLVVALLGHPSTRAVVAPAFADAFLAVSVFVAATFLVFFGLESRFLIDTRALLQRHRKLEVPVAAVLGALPGCGGAVMVVTQFAMGRASFGAVVAVLTSTMGDAAFLVLARRPTLGLALVGVGFVAGIVSGWAVNRIHGTDFLRSDDVPDVDACCADAVVPVPAGAWTVWAGFALVGLVLGSAALLQVELSPVAETVVGVGGACLSIALWALSPAQAVHLAAQNTTKNLWQRVALNTNFVTVWVVLGFVAFEVVGGERLGAAFNVVPVLTPLAGVFIGFVPGCGPQILVTTLVLAGVLPLSAQLGNSISNDGDALFPAIAIAPKAALVATLYTAVPAVVVAYTYHFGWEQL